MAKETQNVSSLDLSGSLASANSVVSMGAASMADVMKQFDANGNMLAKPGTTAVSPTKSLNLPGLQDPSNGGFLTTGGSK